MLDNLLLTIRKKWISFARNINKNYNEKNEKIYNKLKLLFPEGNVDNLYTLYILKRIKSVIVVTIAGIILMFIYYLAPRDIETVINRPNYNEPAAKKEIEFTFLDGVNERKLSLTVNIAPKLLTFDEALLLFDSNKDYVMSIFLNENSCAEHVNSPLNLVERIDDLGFDISWDIHTQGIIRYDGSIINQNISDDGTVCKISASITISGYTFTTPFNVIVYPSQQNDLDIYDKINNFINSDTSRLEDVIDISELINIEDATIKAVKIPGEKLVHPILLITFIVIIVILICLKPNSDLDTQIKKRKKNLLRDYPEISSKFALLTFAGLSVEHAIEKIVQDYDNRKSDNYLYAGTRFAYEELKLTLRQIKAGKGLSAYHDFGRRCGLSCYMKFATLIEQHVSKGNKDFRILLDNEVNDSFTEQKAFYKEMGEKASTKLLIPMVIMMIIIFIIIMVPAFMGMSLS